VTVISLFDICARFLAAIMWGNMHVARIFAGWVHPGVDPGFLVRGDDGGAKGPERPPSEAW